MKQEKHKDSPLFNNSKEVGEFHDSIMKGFERLTPAPVCSDCGRKAIYEDIGDGCYMPYARHTCQGKFTKK